MMVLQVLYQKELLVIVMPILSVRYSTLTLMWFMVISPCLILLPASLNFPLLIIPLLFFTYMIISTKEILNYDFLCCDNIPLRNALTGKGNRYRKCGCLFMPQLFVSGPRFSWIMLLGQKCHRLIHSINCAVGSLVDNNLYL